MDEESVKALALYLAALNAADKAVGEERAEWVPYLDRVAVISMGELVGFLADEIGGSYAWYEANDEERAWWELRPWNRERRAS